MYWIIVFIYLSFAMDFLLWRVPSEASTSNLLGQSQTHFIHKAFLGGVFALSLTLYLAPLLLAIRMLAEAEATRFTLLYLIGLSVSIAGRAITLTAAKILAANSSKKLMTRSLFRWSRNPVVLGLHLTFFGMLLIFPYWWLGAGFVFYLVNIHYKVKIEERHLVSIYGSAYSQYKKSTPRYILL